MKHRKTVLALTVLTVVLAVAAFVLCLVGIWTDEDAQTAKNIADTVALLTVGAFVTAFTAGFASI